MRLFLLILDAVHPFLDRLGMCSSMFLESADPYIGRVDKESLSQQTLMEMVIEDIPNKEKICGDPSVMKDFAEWKGVKIDGDGVEEVIWQISRLRGSLHFEWLPPTVSIFIVWGNRLVGTIDLENLPAKMKILNIAINRLTGSLKLTSLPVSIVELQASSNKFSGSVHLTQLSRELSSLHLSSNQFSGTLDLTRLPDGMAELYLNVNSFSGTVDLSSLPSGIQVLSLSDNQLSGEVFVPCGLFDNVYVQNTELLKRNVK